MDRPRVRQVPKGGGEQGNMEKTGCKIICGAPVTVAVKELMMMMMQGRFGVTATYICCSECVLIISLRVTMVTPVFLESTVHSVYGTMPFLLKVNTELKVWLLKSAQN